MRNVPFSARRLLALVALPCLLFASEANAAQIVALDMKAVGGASKKLAAALTPMMITAVGQRDGISVVSQFEVVSLLEHEGNRQMVGCDETSCMTTIAGALGAELLLASTLARVGSEWQVTLTMINTDSGMAVKRATGSEKGDDTSAGIAVNNAVANLFKDGLPGDSGGPPWLSKRGFEAVVRGFGKAVLDPKQKPRPLRKRISLDLINTELDFDVKPKMDMLDLAIRRGIGAIDRNMLLAKDLKDAQRFLAGRQQWLAVNLDLNRVKEIRTRARERGVAPSSRALRFEDPEPRDEPKPEDVKRYQKEAKTGQKMVQKALNALKKNDKKAFGALFIDPTRGERAFDRELKEIERYKYKYEVLPFHCISPWDYESLIDSLTDDKKLRIYMRKFKKGEIYGDDLVYFERHEGKWKINSW